MQNTKEILNDCHIDAEKIVWRTIDGEAVILNLDSRISYSLNKTGSFIWDLLSKEEKIEKIIKNVSSEYSIPERQARRDVLDIINDFKRESLIFSK